MLGQRATSAVGKKSIVVIFWLIQGNPQVALNLLKRMSSARNKQKLTDE